MGSTITLRRGIAFGCARVASGHMAALPRRAQTRVVLFDHHFGDDW
jgi:hypothetical protein